MKDLETFIPSKNSNETSSRLNSSGDLPCEDLTTGQSPISNLHQSKTNYVNTLSEKEKKSYLIAKSHLGMSFQLEKSVGFIKWFKEQQSTIVVAASLAK